MISASITKPGPAEVEAALILLSRLGISPADLQQAAPARSPAPTFAEYVPVVSGAVSAGTRRVYGSYWNRIVEHWGTRRLDEPTPSEIEHLIGQVKANVVKRRNARGGRLAAEPQQVEQRLGGYRRVGPQQQDRQQQPLLAAGQGQQLLRTVPDLQGA